MCEGLTEYTPKAVALRDAMSNAWNLSIWGVVGITLFYSHETNPTGTQHLVVHMLVNPEVSL